MSELIILLSLTPFVFLAALGVSRLRILLSWVAVGLALACNAYFVFLHAQEPLMWIPVGAFLSLFVLDIAQQPKKRGMATLAVLFISQALLTKDLGGVIILLAFSDMFLDVELFLSSKVEEKNRAVQSIFQSMISFLPAAGAVLLHLSGDWLIACVTATIAFRLFSWPLSHWISEINKTNRLFLLYVGGVSSFALWHVLDFPQPAVWAGVWLCVAAAFSIGARYAEIYLALVLGLFCVSPVLGICGVALWPLLAHQGIMVYVTGLLVAAAGALVADVLPTALTEEASYVIAVLSAVAFARVFVATPVVKSKWYWPAADFVLAGLWLSLAAFLNPPPFHVINILGIVFASAFVVFFLIGKLVYLKKPGLFLPLRSVSPKSLSREFIVTDLLTERRGPMVKLPEGRLRPAFFDALESEMQVALLLGLLGLCLLWGLK